MWIKLMNISKCFNSKAYLHIKLAMSDSNQKVIVGTLIGAALGFAAGLLLAPQSGEETREQIGDKADDVKDDLKDLGEGIGRILDDLKDEFLHSLKSELERVNKPQDENLG